MQTILNYAKIQLVLDTDLGSAEFVIKNSDLLTLDSYIDFISRVSEYIETNRTNYIIFNKKDSLFELDRSTVHFTRDIIFYQFKAFGIRKVLMVVSERQFEAIYKDIEIRNPFMKGFISSDDAYQWIRKDLTLYNR